MLCDAPAVPKRRLGVAIVVPPPVRAEVDGLRRALGDGGLARIPAHLTLVPPVNVNDNRLAEAVAVLRRAAAAARPFALTLGPVATFHPANPVLYLAVSGDTDPLRRLRDAVFRPPLERHLTWPFVPHVTVADDIDPDRIDGAIVALSSFRATFMADRVHLLEEGEDRVWTPVGDFPFAAPLTVGRGGLPLDLAVSGQLDPEAFAFFNAEWDRYAEEIHGRGASPIVPVAVAARREGEVVAAATGEVIGDRAYLASLIVAAGVRGQGVGAHVLARFESAAVEAGATWSTLRTQSGGPAERFYLDHGYRSDFPLPRWRYGRDFIQLRRDL